MCAPAPDATDDYLAMRIVYADESAHDDQLYVIGALIADEAAIVHVQSSLDRIGQIVADAVPGFSEGAEFHAYDMFHGENEWDAVPPALRAKACVLTAKTIARSGARFILRGLNLPQLERRYLSPFPPHELAFAQALESADELLERLGDLAMVVADEHHTAEDGRRRFRRMRADTLEGYSGRQITHLVDTVYFGPSHHSRLLQAADVATYFMCRRHWKPLDEESPLARPHLRTIAALLSSCTSRDYVWPST